MYAQNWVASVFTPVGCSNSVAVSSVAAEMNTSANAAPYAALMVAISAVPAYLLSRRMLTLARMGQR